MRRRNLAQSVVVTVSLAELAAAAGCDASQAEPKVSQAADKQVEEEHKLAPNPPPPDPKEAKEAKEAEKPKVFKYTPKVPGTGPVKPVVKKEGGPEEPDPFPLGENKIKVGDDYIVLEQEGRCTESRDPKCKPGKHCNPPPLRTVKCPKELQLPKAKKKATVYQRKDKTCWEPGQSTCAKGETCDPPPSTRVLCPGKWLPPKKVPKPHDDDDDHSDDDQ